MATDVFNHGPAKIFVNTGSPQFGRPSMGAWVTYGIGSESQDLPGFVVLQSGPRGPRGGAANWGSGFLPTTYQGVPFRTGGEPILNLSSPQGITRQTATPRPRCRPRSQRARLDDTGDPEIATRISSYEMAYRMQSSAPELIDIARRIRRPWNCTAPCPARRRLPTTACWPGGWSNAASVSCSSTTPTGTITAPAATTSTAASTGPARKPIGPRAALDQGPEATRPARRTPGHLGRRVRPNADGRAAREDRPQSSHRRLHHVAGRRRRQARHQLGETDELGFAAVEDRVHVHDLQATILHLLGLDHTKLTYRFQGRDFRLTDVHGNVVKKLLA